MPPSLGRALPVLLAGSGLPHRAPAQGLDTWSYGAQNFWPGIFGSACAGDAQSPVDVNTSKLLDGGSPELLSFADGHKLGPLVWSYRNATLGVAPSVAQGTWSLQLEAPYAASTTTIYYGFEFRLQSLALHSPSENTVDGQHYDMEVQLLHTPTAGQAARHHLVTSVMLRVTDGQTGGAENGFLQSLREGHSAGSGGGILVGNPYEFLYPRDRSYFRFNGSLTTPPCSPAIWVIFTTPVEITAGQLQYFRRTMSAASPSRLLFAPAEPAPAGVTCAAGCPALGYAWNRSLGTNARDLQPLGSRWVKRVQMSNLPAAAEPSGMSGAEWLWWALVGLAVLLLAGGTIVLAAKDVRESRGEDDSLSEASEEGGFLDARSAQKMPLQMDPRMDPRMVYVGSSQREGYHH